MFGAQGGAGRATATTVVGLDGSARIANCARQVRPRANGALKAASAVGRCRLCLGLEYARMFWGHSGAAVVDLGGSSRMADSA